LDRGLLDARKAVSTSLGIAGFVEYLAQAEPEFRATGTLYMEIT